MPTLMARLSVESSGSKHDAKIAAKNHAAKADAKMTIRQQGIHFEQIQLSVDRSLSKQTTTTSNTPRSQGLLGAQWRGCCSSCWRNEEARTGQGSHARESNQHEDEKQSADEAGEREQAGHRA
jgi:hypothetical protein